ncbi:MAG: MoxR family ATPase [Blastocatellia bacterium]|nr:MoxR family ATPase [Blastocatellia bacterium]MDW8167820.1 MoxR family ATPase [Acidobacteriota bacterium]MDW8257544.1 MoxR family ATPase [Acidobacteriota bacterium]
MALPKGAEELLIALQTPSPKGHWGIPALLWGAPGEGKSSFVEGLAREGFPVVTLIASIHDPTDFSGMPVQENGRVRFVPPEWSFAFDEAQQGILFLDELTTAPPSVQAALLRVILERKVGFRDLPSGVRVVAAANPPDMISGGWELSPPLRNRFLHIRWEWEGREYLTALREGFARPALPVIDPTLHRDSVAYWKLLVEAFLRRNPNLVRTLASDESQAFASPRTWEFAIHLMASCDLLGKAPKPGREGAVVFTSLLEGCVGRGAAVAFVGFVKNLHLPDPDQVLEGRAAVEVQRLRDDELYVLFTTLGASLLRRASEQRADLLRATEIFLQLAFEVCRSGRVDTIFIPMKHIARGQILHRAVGEAQKMKRLNELQKLMHRVFDETPLRSFVEMLVED